MNKTVKFLLSFLICFLAAFIGSAFTTPAITGWYAGLNKPFFSPPNWIFGPVWTILYCMMAYSLYIVWENTKNKKKTTYSFKIFGLQLSLNSLWSILFFGLKSPGLAFICIVALWLAIFFTIKNFYKFNKTAGLLLLPYIIWVSFALILNFAVYRLNNF